MASLRRREARWREEASEQRRERGRREAWSPAREARPGRERAWSPRERRASAGRWSPGGRASAERERASRPSLERPWSRERAWASPERASRASWDSLEDAGRRRDAAEAAWSPPRPRSRSPSPATPRRSQQWEPNAQWEAQPVKRPRWEPQDRSWSSPEMDKEPMEAERVTKPGWSGPKERWGAPQRKRRGAGRGSPKKGWSGSRGRGRGRGQGWSGPAKPRDSGDGFRKQQAEDFFHKRSPEPDGSFRKPQADDFFRKRSPEPDDGFRKQQAEDFFRKRSPEPNDGIRKQRAEGFSYKRSPEPDDSFRERSPEPARSRYSEEDLGDWSAESEVEDAKSGGKERAEERVLSRKGKLPAEAVASHPKQSAARTKWMPCKAVSHFWMTRCQVTIGKKARTYLRSTCPRPWLPDYSTRTPVLNKRIVLQLKRPHLRRLSYACRKWQVLENELLDMVGPAMTIYEMAEEALGKGESVEPLELREWARHLLRYAGSLSQRLLFNHRSEVLGTINPQLRNMAQKMKDGTANGRLFTDDDMMLVLEVLAKFPHLVQSPWMERVTPTGRDQPDSTRPWSIAEDFADARPSSSSYP